jgi:hypothetical protein
MKSQRVKWNTAMGHQHPVRDEKALSDKFASAKPDFFTAGGPNA